ncbi:MAG: TonB-dependent receptor, partial [Verrucomicrobia bacterium]|nr:TonB-dependent receptor [Verrucomicrobiota bacterium]
NHVYRRRYFKIDGPWENYTQGYGHDPYYLKDTYQSVRGAGTLSSTWAPPNAGAVFDDETTTDSGLFVMQNYLLNQRLVTTVGLRTDRVGIKSPNAIRDPATQIFRVARPGDPGYARTKFNEEGLRRSVGGVFHLTKNFSLSANTSTGVDLVNDRTRRVLPDDLPPAPIKTRGQDYGLGFSFLDNRLSGSVRYFESHSDNEDTNSRVQAVYTLPNEDIMSSFAHYFQQAGVTTFGASDPIRSLNELTTTYLSNAIGYLSDNVSNGYEFEFIANPTRNWTIRFGYAHSDRKRTNVLTEGEGWWAGRLALWKNLDTLYIARTGRPSVFNQPTVNLTGQTGNLTVAQRIATSAEELAAVRAVEEKGYGNRPDKFNFWTRYAFSTGPLKRLSAGGGMRYQEKNIAGYDVPTNTVLYGKDTLLVDLMLQYKAKGVFKILPDKVGITYQLNVYNLLDNRDVIISSLRLRPSESTSVSGGATGGLATAGQNEPYIRRGWRQVPRTAAFTLRLDF